MNNLQKFRKGDLVRVADDLGPEMSHFHGAGEQAIVVGSYGDQFGGGYEDDAGNWIEDSKNERYTLLFKGYGRASWYEERQLTLIANGQHALAREWIKADGDSGQDQWVFA